MLRVRKIPAALTLTVVALLALSGCTAAGSSTNAASADCTRTVTPVAEQNDAVTVTGEFGKSPTVTMYTPLRTTTTQVRDVIEGDSTGNPIISSDQLVVLDVAVYNAADGELLVETLYDGDLSQPLSMSSWEGTFPGLTDDLTCATPGSRVALTLAPDDLDPQVVERFAIEGAAVAVFDVRKVYLDRANGAEQFVVGNGMPTVVRASTGQPGVSIPDATPPSDVVVEVLKKGTGEVVSDAAPVRVHYTGLTWAERTVFDSSWGKEPISVTLDGVVDGFAQALEGQTVGSQVLVVVPPESGYGDEAQGTIPANSTLVFVIDILGIDSLPAS